MVVLLASNQMMWVRFPSAAPFTDSRAIQRGILQTASSDTMPLDL